MGGTELKFTVRLVLKNLRIGGSKSTALEALSLSLAQNYLWHQAWYDSGVFARFGMSKAAFSPGEMFARFEAMSSQERAQLIAERKAFRQPKMVSKAALKKWAKAIKKIFSEFPDPECIVASFLLWGDLDVCQKYCKMRPGVPCSPMLAKPTRSAQEALKKIGKSQFTCELKYDGLRGQVHVFAAKGVKTVQIFSRGLENLTGKYPGLVTAFRKLADENGLDSLILDGEVMAVEPGTGTILPFQTLMTKKNSSHSVCFYAFDILFKGSRNLMGLSFKDRRSELRAINFAGVSAQVKLSTGWDVDSKKDIMRLLVTAVEMGGEGLMIKSLVKDSAYVPSNRSAQWLKLKKDYIEEGGLGDSFDLVVMGAATGEGKRLGLFGSFLVGCYNAEEDQYESCCMVGTGFSNEMLKDLHRRLKDKVRAGSNPRRLTRLSRTTW